MYLIVSIRTNPTNNSTHPPTKHTHKHTHAQRKKPIFRVAFLICSIRDEIDTNKNTATNIDKEYQNI